MTFRPVKLKKISMRESKIEQTTVASVRKTSINRCDWGPHHGGPDNNIVVGWRKIVEGLLASVRFA
jgi:hypothetical protein